MSHVKSSLLTSKLAKALAHGNEVPNKLTPRELVHRIAMIRGNTPDDMLKSGLDRGHSELDARQDIHQSKRTESNMGLDQLPANVVHAAITSCGKDDDAEDILHAEAMMLRRKLTRMVIDEGDEAKEADAPPVEEALSSDSLIQLLEPLPVTEWNKFAKHRLVGGGAFCDVYIAQFEGSEVALKVLKPQHLESKLALKDLESEARLLHRLKHKNILQVLSEGVHETEDGARPFVVLQRLASVLTNLLPGAKESTPIWERHRQIKAWPLSRAIEVSLQLAEALHYCHYEAIAGYALLHRDLKPDNIGFGADGRLLLFDFGLAKLIPCKGLDDSEPRSMTAQTGSGRYMAPEVALGKPYHRPSEVFSWAIIAWQLASHDKPFESLTVASHLREVAKNGRRPELKSKWPQAFKDMLAASWDAEPSRRRTFRELVPELKALLESPQLHERHMGFIQRSLNSLSPHTSRSAARLSSVAAEGPAEAPHSRDASPTVSQSPSPAQSRWRRPSFSSRLP